MRQILTLVIMETASHILATKTIYSHAAPPFHPEGPTAESKDLMCLRINIHRYSVQKSFGLSEENSYSFLSPLLFPVPYIHCLQLYYPPGSSSPGSRANPPYNQSPTHTTLLQPYRTDVYNQLAHICPASSRAL